MSNKIKFLIFIIALLLIWYLGRFVPIDTALLENFLKKFPLVYSGIIFVTLYCVITFFVFFANDIFKLVSAILFGPYISTLFVFIAETINAFILFHLARYLGRSYIKNSLRDRYREVDERLVNVNFLWLFLFRIVPLIPFRFLDLGSGLTGISFRRYLIAVILGSPLRIFWLQYILTGVGKNVFNPPAMAAYLLQNKGLFIFSLFYIVLVAAVALKLKRKNQENRVRR